MLKNFSLLVFMLLAIFTYGQKSTLLQNINFRAKELKHSLNKTGDSLILKSDKTIYSVEIFNQDFERIVEIGDKKAKISLNGTPIGRLVVQAKMIDKRILMTLLRHETIEGKSLEVDPYETTVTRPKVTSLTFTQGKLNIRSTNLDLLPNFSETLTLVTETRPKPTGLEAKLAISINPLVPKIESLEVHTENYAEVNNTISYPEIKPTPKTSLSNMLNWKPKKVNTNNKVYWIAYEVNSGTSSRKTMKMANQSEVDKLVSKHKIESKSNQGKLNKLTIWEVYDTERFMEKQAKDPEYINSTFSEFFNVVPFYSSDKSLVAHN